MLLAPFWLVKVVSAYASSLDDFQASFEKLGILLRIFAANVDLHWDFAAFERFQI